MTSGVSSIGSGTAGVNSAAAVAPDHSSAFSATVNAQASVSTAATPVSFENPRVVQDPTAGYITQYLSANGSQIISQTPSAITVAYLRNGLTADGTPKHPVTTSA